MPSPTTEDAALEPRSAYGQAKLAIEQLSRRFAARGLAITIVRPCIFYGPRDAHFVPTALRLLQLPVLPLPDGGRHRCDLVYVDDVADALIRAAHCDAAVDRTYNVASGNAPTFAAILAEIAAQARHHPRSVTIPPWLLRAAPWLGRRYLASFGRGTQDVLTGLFAQYIARDVFYHIDRARSEFGFAPRVGLHEGLARAFAGTLTPCAAAAAGASRPSGAA